MTSKKAPKAWISNKYVRRLTGWIELLIFSRYKSLNVLQLLAEIRKEECEHSNGYPLIRPCELFNVYSLAKSKATTQYGDFAEVGTYMGASAKVIAEAKSEKHLYLFDTFAGLPEIVDQFDVDFSKTQYAGNYDYVKRRLAQYPNIHIHKGTFPETVHMLDGHTFCFVHLDVDLYHSTRDSLTFFYPRMTKGGIILSHDYGRSYGVTTAFNEFFEDKPEHIIELSYSQCFIIKGLKDTE